MSKDPRKIVGIDQDGNEWKITLEVIPGYTNRFISHFSFNDREFCLGKYSSVRDANAFWELIEITQNKKKGDEQTA